MRGTMTFLAAAFTVFAMAAGAADEAKIKTLLITGDDVGVHPWKECSQAYRAILEESGRFDVVATEEPLVLESEAALEQYDLIVLAMYNQSKPTLTDAAKENLLNFVKGGKGFVPTHLSSASFKEWDEFGELCGRKWVMGTSGHGPRSVFTAKIADSDHAITEGLEDFEIDDELYAKLQGDKDIHVLVNAWSDWSEKTEPLVFIHQYGEGNVFHTAFGHDAKAVNTPAAQTLFARGCEWAATGEVTVD